ncbi:MAG: hypothetical protein ACM36C_03625, partial [Acidobacteriota bacterium]
MGLFAVGPHAQQAGNNVNVLPILTKPDGTLMTPADNPNLPLISDYYMQRQMEPSIAVSTRNPNHVIAFYNDYRVVSQPDDTMLGEASESNLSVVSLVAKFFRFITGRKPGKKAALPEEAAAAEGWVGMSRSDDGAATFVGGMLPGNLLDGSSASVNSPIYGLEAATDPVVVSAPCGIFHVVFLAFTRGGTSKMTVATYQDENNAESGDTILYKSMVVLETGNNPDNGYFLDKPDIAVDVARSA